MFNINNQTYLVGMFLAARAFLLQGAALCQEYFYFFWRSFSSTYCIWCSDSFNTTIFISNMKDLFSWAQL